MTMKNTSFKFFALPFFCCASVSAVTAQQPYPPGSVYMCHTSGERVISSDRPIPECANKEQRVFGPNGLVIGIIPPAAEARAREQQMEQQKEEERRRAAIESRKEHLLSLYPDAAAHDAKRQAELEPLYNKLKSTNQQIEYLMKQLAEIDEAASSPDTVSLTHTKERESQIEGDIKVQQNLASILRKQIAAVNKKYDEEKEILTPYWKQFEAQDAATTSAP